MEPLTLPYAEIPQTPCFPSPPPPPPRGSPPAATLGPPTHRIPHPPPGQCRRQNILLPKALQVNKPSIPKFPFPIGTSVPPHCQPRTSRQLLRHTPWCGSFHRRHSSNPLGWDCFSHSLFLRGMVCRHSQFQASELITALPICRADAQHYHHRAWQKPHRRVQPDPYLQSSGLSNLCRCEEESGSLGRGRRGRWFSGKDDAQPAPGEFSQRRLPPHQLFGNGSNVPPQPSPALPNPGPAPCPSPRAHRDHRHPCWE